MQVFAMLLRTTMIPPQVKHKFCAMFDGFFDCMNVRAYSEGTKKRKSDLLPYTTSNDTRFKVNNYL